jgi:aryl-alcohol dehydrogenase-like predicted oxidoreductase
VLDQPGVGAALWGARRSEQLDAVPGALDFHLDEEAEREIESILARDITDSVGPEFMAPPEATELRVSS